LRSGPFAPTGGAAGRTVVLLDDIVTTGVTLAAVSRTLDAAGLAPATVAVLAATRKRHRS
ncbi:phosphoribosyltransferase family protein, partial [Micromonospora rosaria]